MRSVDMEPPPLHPIYAFAGEFAFLSNFFHHPFAVPEPLQREIRHAAPAVPTAEHLFQALKIGPNGSLKDIFRILSADSPAKAKRLGREVLLRPGWKEERLHWMALVQRAKYTDPKLRELLLSTGERDLQEGNNWGDDYWGLVKGKGQNHLGKILMQLREELHREEPEKIFPPRLVLNKG